MVRERRGGGLVVRAGARDQGPRLIRVLACFFFSARYFAHLFSRVWVRIIKISRRGTEEL